MSTENPIEDQPKVPEKVEDSPAKADPSPTPPWGDEFDAEKAWNLVQNLRSDNKKLSGREVLSADAKQKLAEYDKLVEASKSDLERLQDSVSAEKARADRLLTSAVASKVEAQAASLFADPSDAAAFLNLDEYAKPDGTVDSDKIKADLADLLTRKPHLGRTEEAREPKPYSGQGASSSGPVGKPQLTLEEVRTLSAAGKHEQIEEARKAGQLDAILGATKQ